MRARRGSWRLASSARPLGEPWAARFATLARRAPPHASAPAVSLPHLVGRGDCAARAQGVAPAAPVCMQFCDQLYGACKEDFFSEDSVCGGPAHACGT